MTRGLCLQVRQVSRGTVAYYRMSFSGLAGLRLNRKACRPQKRECQKAVAFELPTFRVPPLLPIDQPARFSQCQAKGECSEKVP